MYWKVSFIVFKSLRNAFQMLFCDHVLIANAGGSQTFVSRGGMLHRGDGWLVTLKLCFEGHSPSVAATEWTSNNFTCVALTSVRENAKNVCASYGTLVIHAIL